MTSNNNNKNNKKEFDIIEHLKNKKDNQDNNNIIYKSTSLKVNPKTWKELKIEAIRQDKQVQILLDEIISDYLIVRTKIRK